MLFYKIYENRDGRKEAVKQGWSWPAFFFAGIWAFVKKLNVAGGIWVTIIILLAILGSKIELDVDRAIELALERDRSYWHLTGQEVRQAVQRKILYEELAVSVAGLIFGVIFGLRGNSWRENNLKTRGYKLKGEVAAASDEAALAECAQQTSKPSSGPMVPQPRIIPHPSVRMPPPPPPVPARGIFLAFDGKTHGPYTPAEVESYLQEGRITLETMCIVEGEAEWQPLRKLTTES
jgi:hypothetical protein